MSTIEHIGCYLKDIFFNRKTGLLIFRFGEVQKYLSFQNGSLVFAKTNQAAEYLGEILYKLEKIDKETYSKIDQYIGPKKKLGEELVNNNLISESELQDGLNYQMREILLNTFPIFDGEFNFQESDDLSDRKFEVKINIPLLIEDGVRRMKFNPAIQTFLEKKHLFPKSKSFFYRLTEDEKEIYESIKGNVPIESVLQKLKLPPEMFWKNLYLFFCLDLIGIPEKDLKSDSPDVEKSMSTGEREKNIAEALALGENLSKLDYYQLLNVERTADQAEIKRSYFRLARKFHPDLYERDLPMDIKDTIGEVFDQISKAYQTLSDEEKRKTYVGEKEKAPLDDKRNWAKAAEVKFRQGKTLYDKEQYEDAVVYLEEAVKLKGNKGQYFLLLALTQSKIPSYNRKSEKNFLRSIQLEPWNAEGYVGLGMLYKREGLNIKAKKQLEKALSIDPDHRVAQRELNGYEEKKKKTLKQLLSSDIFGKKK